MKITITKKLILSSLLLLCSSALLLAYVSEYVFGYQPCILCLYQRIPYFFIILITIIALIFINKKYFARLAIILSILALLINSGIAFYQVGIEQEIFKMTAKCGDNLSQINSLEELKLAINNKTSGHCDEPELFSLGLSMASWNMIFSFLLAILTIYIFRKRQA